MGYKIAVATSDGINIDLHFGQTREFAIYEVFEDESYQLHEIRNVSEKPVNQKSPSECGGCGSRGRKSEQIAVIEDCRAVLCARCGIGTETELGKRRITSFVIEMPIHQAMEKVVKYYAGN